MKLPRRQKIVFALVVMMAVVGYAILFMPWGLMTSDADRIKEGMSRAEVVAIFGESIYKHKGSGQYVDVFEVGDGYITVHYEKNESVDRVVHVEQMQTSKWVMLRYKFQVVTGLRF